MKYKYYIAVVITGLAIMSASCKRTLETVPVERFTEEYLFDVNDSAGVNAGNFLNNIYGYIPTGFNRVGGDILDAATDDAISSSINPSDVTRMLTGGVSLFFNPDDCFTYEGLNYYTPIRKATIFINSIDVVPLQGFLTDGTRRPLKAAWKAEARTLRALYYFEMVKRYGGMPLLGDDVKNLGDDLELPRNSFAECIKYIADECDKAMPDLRKDPVDALNYGRITQAVAMSLKSRVLLYAASKLYNGGNIDGTNQLTGYAEYDKNRWKLASDAARAVIDLNVFSLHPALVSLFIDRNPEIIFAHLDGNLNITIERVNGPTGLGKLSPTSSGRTSPTHDLVKSFPMNNGLPISDPASGYNAEMPYANRDPRLDFTVFHNDSEWLLTKVQTFNGGTSKPGGTAQQTKTSYYMRKFMGDFTKVANYDNAAKVHQFVIFRYAETLLNFAEATNEFSGPTAEVYDALRSLRRRAGILPGSNAMFGFKSGMTQAEMRQAIYNERRIELTFEEHRFWDIRRWRLAEDVLNKPLTGYELVKDPFTGTITGTEKPVLTPVFPTKMYFYPIRYSEIIKDVNMKQNPGW
ncbi:MAG: RagB/SusD family nutrient uptake outer membrane protein [Mucilaginibacter sp.]